MKRRTREALIGSLKKWWRIIQGVGTDRGPKNCPLCKEFWDKARCVGCPVYEKNHLSFECEHTPYDAWDNHQDSEHSDAIGCGKVDEIRCHTCARLAWKEFNFLLSLLPKMEQKKVFLDLSGFGKA